MSDALNHAQTLNTAARYSAAAWAVAASLVMHLLGFTAIERSGAMVLNETPATETSHVIQASLLPATLLSAQQLASQTPSSASTQGTQNIQSTQSTGFKLEYAPKPNTQPTPKPTPKTASNTVVKAVSTPQTPSTPAAVAKTNDAVKDTNKDLTKPEANVAAPTQAEMAAVPASTATAMPTAPPTSSALPPASSASLPATVPPQANEANVPAQAGTHLSYATPSPSPLAHYQLPNQATVRYEANVAGLSGKSVLSWKKTTDADKPHTQRFEAQLSSSATILFKTFEHRYKSSGVINTTGLMPLNVEEKRTNGSTVATTVEPDNKRVIISSKEGFLPYDPLGKDLVSLMLQLSIYTQTQPLWLKPGTAQDFTVYRPSGIKRWRFQSMGVETIQLKDQLVQAVYIKRVPLSAEPDFEDQHHFWLDPKHYGFPVKMRLVDNKGRNTDIVMMDWQAQ